MRETQGFTWFYRSLVHGEETNNFTIKNRNTTSAEALRSIHTKLSLSQMIYTPPKRVWSSQNSHKSLHLLCSLSLLWSSLRSSLYIGKEEAPSGCGWQAKSGAIIPPLTKSKSIPNNPLTLSNPPLNFVGFLPYHVGFKPILSTLYSNSAGHKQ